MSLDNLKDLEEIQLQMDNMQNAMPNASGGSTVDWQKIADDFKAKPESVCPSCGHCPTCGRGGHGWYKWPYQQQPYWHLPYNLNGPAPTQIWC